MQVEAFFEKIRSYVDLEITLSTLTDDKIITKM